MNRFLLAGLLVAGLVTAPLAVATSASCDVANQTGATLTAVYTGPSGQDHWGLNILDGSIASGGTVSITLDGLSGCKYGFRYEITDKEAFEEYSIDACSIDGSEFEIK